MQLKTPSAKPRPFRLGLNGLTMDDYLDQIVERYIFPELNDQTHKGYFKIL